MEAWKKCSICKADIPIKSKYFVCNVSTCNSKRKGFIFCSVKCWDAHLPMMNHREAWAEERFAPETAKPTTEQRSRRRIVTNNTNSSSSLSSSENLPDDTLVVVSKLKSYIKAKADMNTSGDVADKLSDFLRQQCNHAIMRARQDGRKTVMAKDFS